MNLCPFKQYIEKNKLNCEGIVVLQHGKETASHRWKPEVPKNCRSVSKSFTSIAVGMVIQQGKLSLQDRVLDFFDNVSSDGEHGKRLASLRLEHLLTMTRGQADFTRPATVSEALNQQLKFDPGSRFVYDNGSAFLASAVFTKAMGKTVRDFLVGELFRPLGFADPEWPQSADGYTNGATGLMITTTNMIIFGQFLLQRGQWQGRQLVSPDWIDNAVRPHVSTSDSRYADYNLGYGYYFWPSRYGAYRADGSDGQFIIVLPDRDAVVAISSNEKKHYPVLYAVWDTILPELM